MGEEFRCGECRYDLRNSTQIEDPASLLATPSDGLLKFQRLHLAILRLSQTVDTHNTNSYFLLLGSLICRLVGDGLPNRRMSRLRGFLAKQLDLGIDKTWYFDKPKVIRFDGLTVYERSRYLLMASLLLDPWPDHWLSVQDSLGEITLALDPSVISTPFWLCRTGSQPKNSKKKYLLGTSLAHRFLQPLLAASENIDPKTYRSLEYLNSVAPLGDMETEQYLRRLDDGFLSAKNRNELILFELEFDRWIRALGKLGCD